MYQIISRGHRNQNIGWQFSYKTSTTRYTIFRQNIDNTVYRVPAQSPTPNSKQWPSSSQSKGTRRCQTASSGPYPHKVKAQVGTKQQAVALTLTKWGHKEVPNSKHYFVALTQSEEYKEAPNSKHYFTKCPEIWLTQQKPWTFDVLYE